jgi:hypothetical protein
MSKTDYPALRMKVDRGHLVPAGPFDAERLASYRNGTIVMCRFTEERDRILVKKWFAVLGLVLKQCQTPWKNRDEAHEAIKLALGIVNLTKTVGGDFMQYPKSLAELEDPELQEALDQMIELLSHMTGVDVATLRKETAHVDEEPAHDPQTGEILEGKVLPPETQNSDAPPPSDEQHVEPQTSAEEAGTAPEPVSSPDPDASAAAGASDSAGDPPPSSGGSPAPQTEREMLIQFARDVLPMAADTTISPSATKAVEKEWAPLIMAMSADGIAKARTISESMRSISNNPAKLEGVLKHYAEMLDCSVDDLRG